MRHCCSRSKSQPKYNDKFDFEDFRLQFEGLAEDEGWSYDKCGFKLRLCLTDAARGVLSTLTPEERRDYDSLCEALASLHTTPGGYYIRQKELRETTRKEGQCPSEFAREVRRKVAKAYPGKANEEKVLEIFIQGLGNEGMERHVAFKHPNSRKEAVELACEFHAFSGSANKLSKPLQSVAQVDASSSQIETELKAIWSMVNPLSKGARGQKETKNLDPICFNCHKTGHYSH